MSRAPHGDAPVATQNRSRPRRAIVIGAGMGGLGTAARLAHAGYQVTLLEKHDVPGGRGGVWKSEGFSFDTGPSLVMMTEVWQKLFRDVGRRFEDYVTLVPCDPNYRLTFEDGTSLVMSTRLNELLANFEKFEPGVTPRALKFFAHTGELYRRGIAFVYRNMHRLSAMLRVDTLGPKYGLAALGDLQRMVRRYFKDRRLQQAMTFQSLYLGLSPYNSLAVYGLLAYTEVAGGIYYPMGGMHQLARALERLGAEFGVQYRYNTSVARLQKDGTRVTGVVLADGSVETADVIVANADLPYVYDQLLGEPHPRTDRFEYSCSVVLLYLGVKRQYPHLFHHNLAVSNDLEKACHALFVERTMPHDPPIYYVATTRTDPSQAPPGCESLYVLALAPSHNPKNPIDWTVEGPRVAARTIERLEALGCTDLSQHIVTQKIVTPDDFTARFGNLRGEAFGLAHNFSQIGYFRPHNRHAKYKNLFFAGQSTHPGCGLPIVLMSADLVVQRILEEQPMSPSRRIDA